MVLESTFLLITGNASRLDRNSGGNGLLRPKGLPSRLSDLNLSLSCLTSPSGSDHGGKCAFLYYGSLAVCERGPEVFSLSPTLTRGLRVRPRLSVPSPEPGCKRRRRMTRVSSKIYTIYKTNRTILGPSHTPSPNPAPPSSPKSPIEVSPIMSRRLVWSGPPLNPRRPSRTEGVLRSTSLGVPETRRASTPVRGLSQRYQTSLVNSFLVQFTHKRP